MMTAVPTPPSSPTTLSSATEAAMDAVGGEIPEAEAALLDAERLAAALLAAAEREARDILGRARRSYRPDLDDPPPAQDPARARHEEILAELAECRREFRAVLESFRHRVSDGPRSSGRGAPSPGATSDDFLAALYRAVAGIEPLDPGWWTDDDADAVSGTATHGHLGTLRLPVSSATTGVVVTLASRRTEDVPTPSRARPTR